MESNQGRVLLYLLHSQIFGFSRVIINIMHARLQLCSIMEVITGKTTVLDEAVH